MKLKDALEKLYSGNCPSGLKLGLVGNNSGYEGAQALAEALVSVNCPKGLQLNLDWNYFGYAGAQALACALASGNCPSGLHLDLSDNKIGNKGAQAFADALASGKCPSALNLVLRYYEISHKSAEALANALKSGKCRFGTMINIETNKYDFAELSKRNDCIIHQAALGVATLISGFSQRDRRVKASPVSRLPVEIIENIAKFLPGNISAVKIAVYLDKSFHYLMKTHIAYSHKMRCTNEKPKDPNNNECQLSL